MGVSQEQIDASRDIVCKKIIQSIDPFMEITDSELAQAMMFSSVACASDGVSEDDMQSLIDWAISIHNQCIMLQFVLAGAAEFRWHNGDIELKMTNPDESMRNLVRFGIAK